ncbi:hypothetical protein ACFLS4_02470, partial [Bacteroidota bacterium]
MRKNFLFKQHSKGILYICGLIIGFTSCSPEYVPNMVNSPMFSNQGEFQLTVATGNSNFDAQTAVAITDNIGIMMNGSYGNETNDSTADFHKHSFIEGGIGYYDKFGEKGRYEIYGGYGIGQVEGYFKNNFVEEITNARYNRFFIQPGIGIASGIYDGSFSPRFALVQMNPKGPNFQTGEYDVFFEPVITNKIGFKYVKFIAQFGFSLPMGDQELNYDH